MSDIINVLQNFERLSPIISEQERHLGKGSYLRAPEIIILFFFAEMDRPPVWPSSHDFYVFYRIVYKVIGSARIKFFIKYFVGLERSVGRVRPGAPDFDSVVDRSPYGHDPLVGRV